MPEKLTWHIFVTTWLYLSVSLDSVRNPLMAASTTKVYKRQTLICLQSGVQECLIQFNNRYHWCWICLSFFLLLAMMPFLLHKLVLGHEWASNLVGLASLKECYLSRICKAELCLVKCSQYTCEY